ncbi:MAG: DNA alkylation repair protein [Tenericutes bacterium]|nr:DNA alkylation repair protein [Mycoplasmatota bacterium]
MIESLKTHHRYKELITSSKYHKEYVKGQQHYYVGISVPTLRKIAKENYNTISKVELIELITYKIHEYRLLAVYILGLRMLKSKSLQQQKEIVEFYLEYIKYINNWDLVDASCYQLLGKYLYNIDDYSLLYEFSHSDDLWIKRISIVSTNHLIRNNILGVTLDIVDNLLSDDHDLIHKANGWMLRNVGDKDISMLTEYIYTNYNDMPRTTLRYAIEHYPEKERKSILKGDFSWK